MLGVSRESLKAADEVIRSLDPKPASRIGESDADDRTRHIIPDFYVDVDQNDRVTVTMPNNIPDLVIERSFVAYDNGGEPWNASSGNDRAKLSHS